MNTRIQLATLLAISIGLVACAAKVTASSGRTVVVKAAIPDTGVEKALVLADAECAKQRMTAVIQSTTSPNTDRYIFQCVSR